MKKNLSAEIFKAGLVAGTLDILLAFVNAGWSSGVTPARVLRFIASGLTGAEAFSGGPVYVGLGLVLHFLIVFSWSALFFLLYPKFSRFIRSKILQAILYGLVIWGVMNFGVLPLSRVPGSGFHWGAALKGMGILIIAVGGPLAYFAGRYWRGKR